VGSDDPLVTRAEIETGRNPGTAVDFIARQIADTNPASTRRITELYEAQMIALSMSGQDVSAAAEKARRVAARLDAADPVRQFLRFREFSEASGEAERAQVVEAMARDYETLPVGSSIRTCRAIDLVHLYSEMDKPSEAFTYAAQAYRNSDGDGMSLERATAAAILSDLVSLGYDFDYAEQLHSEALDIQLALGMNDLAANELVMRGYTKLDASQWDGALRDFEASTEQARAVGNAYAVAYAQVGVCRAALAQDKLKLAGPACEQAYRALNKPGERMSFAVTALMAKLLVERGEADRALRLLDPVIESDDAKTQGDDWILALETHAKALSLLHRDAEAYASMRRASEAADAYYEQERQSGITAMRARFKTEELQGSLADEQERSEARLRLARWVVAGAVTSLTLLGVIVFILLNHRRRFRRLAMTDPLTGLCNRRAMLEKTDEALRSGSSARPRASFALLDVDHFKSCNDAYGHSAGDKVLSVFARIIERNVRPSDVVGRWGGEEFLLTAPGASVAEAAKIVERIRHAAERETFEFAPDYRLRFSAGIAQLNGTEDRTDECIKLADRRLYAAKRLGRNRTCTTGEEVEPASASQDRHKAE
tara:strand:- start:4156 stop:5955 length:1800 start_codon:yes stop_codon:yes gene_type:complete